MKKGKGKLKKWLKEKGKDTLGNVLNGIGENTSIPILSNLIEGIGESLMNDPDLSPEEKAEAAEIIKAELDYLKVEQQEVTKRWNVDMVSDSWLSKNIRPIVLAFLMLFMAIIIIVDSTNYFDFEVKDTYITLLSSLLLTVIVAYFGSRGIEKYQKIKHKK